MARDDFSRPTIDRLAKRAGMKCSNPDCRLPTAGPDADGGVTNTGVAAHICAASPGGARYDPDMTPEQRSGMQNAIWLCQNHAKLIDDDELGYPPSKLHQWKEVAEKIASVEALGFSVRKARPFADLERKAPALIAEMRANLSEHPIVRQIIVLPKQVSYNYGPTPCFTYHYEDHPEILAIMTIMMHFKAIYDVRFNDVPRYNMTEEFVSYLIGEG